MQVDPAAEAGLQELVRELAEWRLTEYLDRAVQQTSGAYTLKVSHASGRPILFLPEGAEREDLPAGWTDIRIDGEAYSANFGKVALNVVRRPGADENELPRILQSWFGPEPARRVPATSSNSRSATACGNCVPSGDAQVSYSYGVRTRARRSRRCSAWSSPSPSGTSATSAANGHIFLLTTLDKAGHGSEFQYKDHFVSPTEFEWHSQKRLRPARGAKSPSASAWGWGPTRSERSTTQASADGQDIRHHVQRGIPVHLFVRAQKKLPGGGAAPFVNCGDVTFVSWKGERPITVRWRLPEPVPERLRGELRVPA